jgi:hypothetical protein
MAVDMGGEEKGEEVGEEPTELVRKISADGRDICFLAQMGVFMI